MAHGGGDGRGYIVAVDIGTTVIRSRVHDETAVECGKAQRMVEVLYPTEGRVEINPDALWRDFVGVVRDSVADAQIPSESVRALGICTQRGTILTWDKETGQYYHNFITWQDKRSADECQSLNNSWTMAALRNTCKLLYSFSRKPKYLVGRTLELVPAMACLRLKWLCENEPELKKRLKDGKVMGGDIGTWLLWKLTGGRVYGYEISLASSSGMFDPYVLAWAGSICTLFGIPYHFLPTVSDTSGKLGDCSRDIFGVEVPITAMAGDQQAATFGSGCFDVGSVKLSLGTGAFIDINTGGQPHASVDGLHPMVGWRFNGELVYIAESFSNDAGSVVMWGQSIGLFEKPEDTSDIAKSVEDTNGVYFIPAFSGLQVPVNNAHACTSFFGLKPSTTKAHMTRAILEAIAFRVYQVFRVVQEEAPFGMKYIRCVGGVARNDFVCQMIADLCEQPLSTMDEEEVGSLGITFLAGIGAGIWTSVDDIRHLITVKETFEPCPLRREKHLKDYRKWQQALERSLNWYKDE